MLLGKLYLKLGHPNGNDFAKNGINTMHRNWVMILDQNAGNQQFTQ
jgi:hypothetical protein